jgi:septum formation protein
MPIRAVQFPEFPVVGVSRFEPISAGRPLLLVSGSPRRRDILTDLRIPFTLDAADVDESQQPGDTPPVFLERVARHKMSAALERLAAKPGAHAAALVADTIVVIDDTILGKPVDVPDALRLLRLIVGREHRVFTRYGVAVSEEQGWFRSVESRVWIRAAQSAELERYAATGEGLDKAGAYAVQGLGAFLVERVEGSYTNVVGLPASHLVSDLVTLGLLVDYPWAG